MGSLWLTATESSKMKNKWRFFVFLLTASMVNCCNSVSMRQKNEDADEDIVHLIRSGRYHVVDTRSNVSREVHGFIPSSYFGDNTNKTALYIVEEAGKSPGICSENSLCYDGPLDVFNDIVEFPKGVSFQALVQLLDEKRIVLIDVRNATELEDPGQIPGSVHLPLYEVTQAFNMNREQFEGKYGFVKPNIDDKNVVLTCRSGRRILVADSRLQNLGYNHIRLYYGSFKDWKKNGGK